MMRAEDLAGGSKWRAGLGGKGGGGDGGEGGRGGREGRGGLDVDQDDDDDAVARIECSCWRPRSCGSYSISGRSGSEWFSSNAPAGQDSFR